MAADPEMLAMATIKRVLEGLREQNKGMMRRVVSWVNDRYGGETEEIKESSLSFTKEQMKEKEPEEKSADWKGDRTPEASLSGKTEIGSHA